MSTPTEMVVSKGRGAAKRLGPLSLGSKVIRFKVTNIDRRFTVHEDLICRTSTLFKNQLQKNRKQLRQSNKGEECCVCYEELDPITKDITYCASCGNNVHESCIDEWRQSGNQRGNGSNASTTCPMCRAEWKNDSVSKCLDIEQTLDAKAVQIYLDWLYTNKLHIPEDILRTTDTFNVAILKCWAVAGAVGDHTFKYLTISTFFEDAMARFWSDTINWAFVEEGANDEIKEFILDSFMIWLSPGWFKRHAAKWPDVFVRELADAVIDCVGDTKKSYGEFKRVWTEKLKGMGEPDQDEETHEVSSASSTRRSPRHLRPVLVPQRTLLFDFRD